MVLMHFIFINMSGVVTPLEIDPEIMGTAEGNIHKNQEDKMIALYSTI